MLEAIKLTMVLLAKGNENYIAGMEISLIKEAWEDKSF